MTLLLALNRCLYLQHLKQMPGDEWAFTKCLWVNTGMLLIQGCLGTCSITSVLGVGFIGGGPEEIEMMPPQLTVLNSELTQTP